MKNGILLLGAITVISLSSTTLANIEVSCPTYKQINSAFRHNQDCKADGYCAEKINGHSFQIAAKNCTNNCEFDGFQYLKSAFLNNNYLHCVYGPNGHIEWESSSTYQIGEDCTLTCAHNHEILDLFTKSDNSCTAICKNKKEIMMKEEA